MAGVIVDEGEAGLWKLLVEPRIPMNGWQVSRYDIAAIWAAFFSRCQRHLCGQGPFFPNATSTAFETTFEFGCKEGCLFRIDVSHPIRPMPARNP